MLRCDFYPNAYFLSLPFWRPLDAVPQGIETLFAETEALVLRFPGSPSLSLGQPSHLLLASRPYDLSSLHPKARNQTRRGLENCSVKPISFERLAEAGYEAILDTAQRQGVPPQGKGSFEGMCKLMGHYPCWIAWGAHVGDRLAAFLIALHINDSVSVVVERSVTDLLSLRPNNALVYEFTKWALTEANMECVSFGMGALEGDEAQDHFKARMGYQMLPIVDVVIVRPPLGTLTRLVPHRLLSLLTTWAERRGKRNWVKALALARAVRCSLGWRL